MSETKSVAELLKELWHQYDHGGHSMRSERSQVLETTWPTKDTLTQEDFALPDGYVVQGILFEEPRYLNDVESTQLAILWLERFYANSPESSQYESDLVFDAAIAASIPEFHTQLDRILLNYLEPYDLVTELRMRGKKEREYGFGDIYW